MIKLDWNWIDKLDGYCGVAQDWEQQVRARGKESIGPDYQWEFQDPKMEVLYHIRPYFLGIFPYIGLI